MTDIEKAQAIKILNDNIPIPTLVDGKYIQVMDFNVGASHVVSMHVYSGRLGVGYIRRVVFTDGDGIKNLYTDAFGPSDRYSGWQILSPIEPDPPGGQ
jgi:hypothetical protein